MVAKSVSTSLTPLHPLLLDNEQVAVLVGLCARKIRGMVSAGEFPKPVKIGRSTRWRRSEVEEWVQTLE